MKYITFTVPCYNSQSYMRRCIDSLLPGGEDVEIIIVDDGSTDNTGIIADAYESEYPDIVKAVHKENGGHGSGVNAGLKLASGKYYKVVDSDDWLDAESYQKLLHKIKEFCAAQEKDEGAQIPDMIVANYVYDHLEEGKTNAISYRNVFPVEKMCHWNEIGHFLPSQYLVMHTLYFRTALLREVGVELPEHTFYVDNLFAYRPLPSVKNIYYMDIDLYHYYLGREDQSVNEKMLMKRIDQQIKVTKLVADSVDLEEVKRSFPRLAEYMYRNISIMMTISCIHLLLIGDKEAYGKRKQLWEDIRDRDKGLYYRLRFTTLSGFTYLPGKLGGMLTLGGYRAAKKIVKFQ